jgi:ribosomal protein S18 acetylase RimI-like enzyme
MKMLVRIREALAADRSAVERMLRDCAAFNAEEVRVALELFDEGPSGGYALLVAEADDAVRGYVCVGQAPLTESTWYVYWICVHPSAQRRGVGQALQHEAEELVRRQGGERLVLETSGRADYHRSRQFYESAGYRSVGRIDDFYRRGDDAIIYVKYLGPESDHGAL